VVGHHEQRSQGPHGVEELEPALRPRRARRLLARIGDPDGRYNPAVDVLGQLPARHVPLPSPTAQRSRRPRCACIGETPVALTAIAVGLALLAVDRVRRPTSIDRHGP
jgi:hypothetical protein